MTSNITIIFKAIIRLLKKYRDKIYTKIFIDAVLNARKYKGKKNGTC